ncbi:hypothetical protein QR64_09120 [Rhodococcus sp. Chr-9]|nr:hypothetical protein QR64_09120 [Rhodococcus sp. Chr-9]OBA37993.1 hypothetical protein A5767_06105 [Rhodococcus sp. 852002-51564_SCH6189132-a]
MFRRFRVPDRKESGHRPIVTPEEEEMAPQCAHCHCRILGHGVESADAVFCCAHCARQAGHAELADRA